MEKNDPTAIRNKGPADLPCSEVKPAWLKVRMPSSGAWNETRYILQDLKINTVCQSACCPNMGECWSRRTATFLILGDTCTRCCRFCSVKKGLPQSVDNKEPLKVACAAAKMGLRHIVVTSVTRDDLPDNGATHWASTLNALGDHNPDATIEVLIPDFQGNENSLQQVLDANPSIVGHNIETIQRLQKELRCHASYQRSLNILCYAHKGGFTTKSGLMLGLGEQSQEIEECLQDLHGTGCSIVSLGQYLRPTSKQVPVKRWVPPEEFEHWKTYALSIGFRYVFSGPLVRTSYHAEMAVSEINNKRETS